MDCGDGDAAATGNLPDRQTVFEYGIFHSGSCFRHDFRSENAETQ
jgi:hypothetical protein